MLVQQDNPIAPLTPVSTPPDVQHSEMSPRSTNSSFASTDSLAHESSPNSTPKESAKTENNQGLSALQRLEFALERNSLFSKLLQENAEGPEGTTARLVKPCPSSASSCNSDSPNAKHDNNSSDHSGGRMKTHTPASSPDDGTNPTNIIFQCPLCSVICNSRHEFNEHLVTHSQQHACPKCTFLTDNEDILKDHVAEVHDVSDFEELLMTDDEVRTPKTNSQGKVKTFKCKQCGHHAVTKMEFWDHTKTHIRSEKMLTCPKCPFVTEYKHHLEYHLRNHYGSKPFQCNKCPYSCVNKSMLNSHLKSHSNIYQYRCADCSYATKYCHSLKLHLRKYNHKPAMVLNPDGTPNPLPIIDVYGTRRGPKIKRSSSDQTTTETNQEIQALLSPPQLVREKTPKSNRNGKRSAQERRSDFPRTPPESPRYRDDDVKQENLHKLFDGPQKSPREEMLQTERSNIANFEFVRNSNNNIMLQHVQQAQQNALPVPDLMSSLNPAAIQGLLMANPARNQTVNPVTAMALQSLLLQNSANQAAMDFVKSPAHLYAAAAFGQYLLGNPALHNASRMEVVQPAEDQQRSNIAAQFIQRQPHSDQPNPKPSNLPATATPSPSNNRAVRDMETAAHTPLDLRNPRCTSDFSRHKRKGKAMRYEYQRSPQETSTSNDSEEVLDFSRSSPSAIKQESKTVVMNGKNDVTAEESRVCKYCDISFPPILYDLHMKFHSNDADPFRCLQCGAVTKDKVGFFIHLATASHS